MSDYLANLVQRTLDRERVIRPRLPSLFDPARPASNAFEPASRLLHQPPDQVTEDTVLEDSPADPLTRSHPFSGDTQQAFRERFDNPGPRFAERPVNQPPARPPDNRAPVFDRAGIIHNPAREEQTTVPLRKDQPARSSTLTAERPPYLTPRLSADEPPGSRPDPPRSAPPIQAAESNASAGKPSPVQPVTQDAATAGSLAYEINRQPGEPSPAARSRRENRLSEPADQPPARPAIILRPRIVPYVEQPAAAQQQAPAAGAAAPESVVNITIGRIEVRATPPPAARAARSASASSPVMTLGDYLRRRANGGGR